jgi:hypothetical protein
LVFALGQLEKLNITAGDCDSSRRAGYKYGIAIYVTDIDIWNNNGSIFRDNETPFDLTAVYVKVWPNTHSSNLSSGINILSTRRIKEYRGL